MAAAGPAPSPREPPGAVSRGGRRAVRRASATAALATADPCERRPGHRAERPPRVGLRLQRAFRRPGRAVVCSRTPGRVNAMDRVEAPARRGENRSRGDASRGRPGGGCFRPSGRMLPPRGIWSRGLSEYAPIHCQSMIYPTTYTLSVGCRPIALRYGARHRAAIFWKWQLFVCKHLFRTGQRLSTFENSVEYWALLPVCGALCTNLSTGSVENYRVPQAVRELVRKSPKSHENVA